MSLTNHLGALESVSLIRLAHALPELEYMFRHALVQDAACASLLKEDRRRLHLAVGETLARVYPERREELAALLAEHFHLAGDETRAREYFALAGDCAARQYALPEAIAHYTRAIDIATAPTLPELYRLRGSVHETLGDFERARSDYEAALQVAQGAGDSHAEWQVLLSLGFLWTGSDYTQTHRYYQRALELARVMGDPAAIAHSLNRVGNWHINVEQPEQALRCHQEALATFQALEDTHSVAETLDLLGISSYLSADITQGMAYYRKAIELFRVLDDRRGLVSSLVSLASRSTAFAYAGTISIDDVADSLAVIDVALQDAREIGWRVGEADVLLLKSMRLATVGRYTEAFDNARASLALTEAIGHHEWMTFAHFMLGTLYLDLEAFAEAQQHVQHALELAKTIGSFYWIRITSAHLALIYLAQRQAGRAREVLDAALPLDAPAETLGQRTIWYARAEIALAAGTLGAARALEIADMLDAAAHLPADGSQVVVYALSARAKALLALHRYAEAEAPLKQIHDIALKWEARPMQWRILALLSQAYRGQGRDADARQALATAHDIARLLAVELRDDALRDHLLGQARALLDHQRIDAATGAGPADS